LLIGPEVDHHDLAAYRKLPRRPRRADITIATACSSISSPTALPPASRSPPRATACSSTSSPTAPRRHHDRHRVLEHQLADFAAAGITIATTRSRHCMPEATTLAGCTTESDYSLTAVAPRRRRDHPRHRAPPRR
jgi:hypothetical protein